MKRIISLLVLIFTSSILFAQEGFQLGIVKGQHVTYQCSLFSKEVAYPVVENGQHVVLQVKKMTIPFMWSIWDVHNPDTAMRPYKKKLASSNTEVHWQIAEILHKQLSSEELRELAKSKDYIMLTMRVGNDKHKLLQVTRFTFWRYHPHTGDSLTYNGFWLNLSPDRLHELEKAIVNEVVVPDDYELYGTDDFVELLGASDIVDPEKTRQEEERQRQEMIELGKKELIKN